MLPSLAALDTVPGMWAIAYCKARQEKMLARDLCRLEVPYFLPMALRERMSGGRRRRTMELVFNSYLFYAGGESERLAVLKTNRIVQVFKIDPSAQPTFRREISSLELALRTSAENIELHPQLVTGKRVLITGGPMQGVEGVVFISENLSKLWIGITMMGAGTTVEVNADLLEPLADDPEKTSAGQSNITSKAKIDHRRRTSNL